MIWGAQYLIQRVESQDYGRIDIFTGHIDDHKGHHPFLTLREKDDNGAKMVERVRNFLRDVSGQYTVYLRPYHNAPWPQAEKLYIDVIKELAPVNGTPTQMDVEALVNQRITDHMAAVERDRVLRELKEENERLKNPVERIALLAEMVISKYVKPDAIPATVQGTTANVNTDDFQKAVNGLVQKFTAAGIIKLNRQLDENPHMIQLVKDYVRI